MEGAPAGFAFFDAFTISRTPSRQDVSSEPGLIRQERGSSEAAREREKKKKKATGFILFAAILPVASLPRQEWTERSFHLQALLALVSRKQRQIKRGAI